MSEAALLISSGQLADIASGLLHVYSRVGGWEQLLYKPTVAGILADRQCQGRSPQLRLQAAADALKRLQVMLDCHISARSLRICLVRDAIKNMQMVSSCSQGVSNCVFEIFT